MFEYEMLHPRKPASEPGSESAPTNWHVNSTRRSDVALCGLWAPSRPPDGRARTPHLGCRRQHRPGRSPVTL